MMVLWWQDLSLSQVGNPNESPGTEYVYHREKVSCHDYGEDRCQVVSAEPETKGCLC